MPFIRRPMGRGSEALTWWESLEVAKVAWHPGGGGGQGGESLLAPPRQGRQGKSGGKRGWEEDQAAATCRIRLPLRPREARAGRRGPSPPARPGRHSPLPPFFPANVYLNARAHTEIVRLFYPSGKKEQGVERKRRQSEELLGRALHSEPRLGAGTLLPPPPPALSPALRRVPVGVRARALDPGDTERLLAATAAAGRRDSGEKGPATAFPSSAAPAGPRRQPGAGKQGGAEAPEKRAAARPPVDAAPGGAQRQLCRVTRSEDCRASRPGGLGAASERGPRGGAPPHRALLPPAGSKGERPAHHCRRLGRPCPRCEQRQGEALRCGRGAPAAAPSAAPRPGGSGTFASVSRATCVRCCLFPPPWQPGQAKPSCQRRCRRSSLSLHPDRGTAVALDAERMGRLQMPRRPETPARH